MTDRTGTHTRVDRPTPDTHTTSPLHGPQIESGNLVPYPFNLPILNRTTAPSPPAFDPSRPRACSLPNLHRASVLDALSPQSSDSFTTMSKVPLLGSHDSISQTPSYGGLQAEIGSSSSQPLQFQSAPIRAPARSSNTSNTAGPSRRRRRSCGLDCPHDRTLPIPVLRKAKSSSSMLQSLGGFQPNIEIGVGERISLPIQRDDDTETRSRLSDLECASLDDDSGSTTEDDILLSPGYSSGPDQDPTDDSLNPLVRASVPPTDDISLSINTPRMWFFSLLFAFLGSSSNLFFSLRYPSVSITPMIALLLVHPLGLLWDRLLKQPDDPVTHFVNGSPTKKETTRVVPPCSSKRRRLRLWLAQGEWNEKEHCCVFISSNVSFGFAFATDVIVEQTMFYKQDFGIMYQILLILSTQILGYSIAGLTRRFLVQPTEMLWLQALNTASMFSTLHKSENKPANGWTISKYRFFIYVFCGSLAFYFLPGLLFPALSYFNFITWFAPKNVVVSNLFGVASGLGLFPLTFDWAQVAYIGSPLIVPIWAAANIIVGIGLVIWILAPLLYYSNFLYSAFMPIISTSVFDNTGHVYDVSRILNDGFLFDEEGYKNYSRVFLPITYVLSYFGQFAGLAALVTDTVVWHGRELSVQLKATLWPGRAQGAYQAVPCAEPSSSSSMGDTAHGRFLSGEDVHNRLMRRYDDVPMIWYILTGVSMATIGMFVVQYYPIFLPWWGLLLALAISIVLYLPIAMVQAVANQHISIYLICQLLSGTFFPGKPVANMVFTTYGYISMTQGIKFSSDLKLGHYMKVPPKILFSVQLVATIASSLAQLAVLNWMLANVPGICTTEAVNGFTCPLARVHFNGSILWGVVGPARFFGQDGMYRHLLWAFPLGACLPLISYWAFKRTRRSIFRDVNFPVMLSSLSWIPPATGLNFSVWAVVCWIFNDVIKNRAFAWWTKYNMTLSVGLDSGLAAGVCIIFFGFVYPGLTKDFTWWGTEVYKQGCDWQACSFKQVPPGGRFGPPT